MNGVAVRAALQGWNQRSPHLGCALTERLAELDGLLKHGGLLRRKHDAVESGILLPLAWPVNSRQSPAGGLVRPEIAPRGRRRIANRPAKRGPVASGSHGAQGNQQDEAREVRRHGGEAFVRFGGAAFRLDAAASSGQGFLRLAMKRMAASISAGVQSSQLPFGGIASTPCMADCVSAGRPFRSRGTQSRSDPALGELTITLEG